MKSETQHLLAVVAPRPSPLKNFVDFSPVLIFRYKHSRDRFLALAYFSRRLHG
jgi:hypothetical protein